MENSQGLKKRRSFRRWIKKVTTPKVTPLLLPSDFAGKPPGVFGIPLVISISYARGTIGYQDETKVHYQRAAAIPLVVSKCGAFLKRNGLETEGIFRLSGSAKRVTTLQHIFDSPLDSYGLHLSWKNYSVHDAGSVLRRYFLQLPDPVIPKDFYQPFRDVMNDSMYNTTHQRIDAFQDLICQLPTVHQHLLLYVLDLLRLFATHASVTRMDASNLAAVFTPGLLNHPQHNSPVQYMISQRVIEFLIEYQNLFSMDLLIEQNKPVEPDESLVSPNIVASPTSLTCSIPPVPAIPSQWATATTTTTATTATTATGTSSTSSSLLVSPQSPIPCRRRNSIKSSDINDDMDIPTTQLQPPSSPIPIQSRYRLNWIYALDWIKGLLDPYLFLWYLILTILLSTFSYEAYLLFGKVALIEPFLFFTGFIGYNLLMILGTDTTTLPLTPLPDIDTSIIEKYYIYDDDDDDDDDDDFDKCSIEDELPVMNNKEMEEEVWKDKEVMANWQHLITRSWRAGPDDLSPQPAYPPLGRDEEPEDTASMMSMASRFNEIEDEESTSDEDLEQLWARYEQFNMDQDLV